MLMSFNSTRSSVGVPFLAFCAACLRRWAPGPVSLRWVPEGGAVSAGLASVGLPSVGFASASGLGASTLGASVFGASGLGGAATAAALGARSLWCGFTGRSTASVFSAAASGALVTVPSAATVVVVVSSAGGAVTAGCFSVGFSCGGTLPTVMGVSS